MSGPLRHSTNIPPVPTLPSKQEIDQKEALWATYAQSGLHTPPSTSWGPKAALSASYGFPRSVSSPTPQRALSGGLHRERSPVHLNGTEALRKQPPPSSFRQPLGQASRPRSSMSTTLVERAMSPCPGGFIPNPLDELDKELARQLKTTPTCVKVERVDPPLRKGQLHEGEWNARYCLTISGERKTHACRLLEMIGSGTNTSTKMQKVMIRDRGGEFDSNYRHPDI